MKRDQLRVGQEEIAAAVGQVEPEFKRSLNRAVRQIASFHKRQRTNSWIDTPRPGTLLGQMVHPVDAAGVYVPGGQGGSTQDGFHEPGASTLQVGAQAHRRHAPSPAGRAGPRRWSLRF